jgi:hypothetical protein
MIALSTFWVTLVFLTKATLAAFGAGLALLAFGAIFMAILLPEISCVLSRHLA